MNFPEAVFAGCLLLFLATMTLVAVSRHLGLMWVGVEATTLASAPLIYFHRHHRSLEATWKYLLICSVGIALALLGNFFVAVAARSAGGPMIHLTIDDLVAHARCERRAKKPAPGRGDLRRIVRSGVLGRTRQFVTDTWFGRTSTTVTDGEEHRCSRTWKNGLRFVGVC